MLQAERLEKLVKEVANNNFVLLRQDMSVATAIETIRSRGTDDSYIYFYVADSDGKLSGVLPTRRLLAMTPETSIAEIMIRNVVAIPETATLLDACEVFVLHKFFAFPVVDAERRVVGTVDIGLFTDEVLDDDAKFTGDNDIFETIGFTIRNVRGTSPLEAFRYRFPWLSATIASGVACAFLTGFFQETLEKAIVLAFFLTLALGLGESVGIQAMTLTLHELHKGPPTLRKFLKGLLHELRVAILLGLASGTVVGTVVWLWRGNIYHAASIGISILLSLSIACVIGRSVPTTIHAMRLDPKIASGPITLALADLFTILFYFTIANILFAAFGL